MLGKALTTLANQRGGPIGIDAFKLSHHASQGNVTPALLALAPAHHYIVSTNGDLMRQIGELDASNAWAVGRFDAGPIRRVA